MSCSKNISELIKKHIPSYEVHDATNKTSDYLFRITKLCEKVTNVIVFAKYTETNKEYFNFLRRKQHIKKPMTLLFLYNTNIYLFEEPHLEQNIEGVIRCLSNCITLQKNICVICLEEKNEIVICSKCGSGCCEDCILKFLLETKKHVKCPVCKSFQFTR